MDLFKGQKSILIVAGLLIGFTIILLLAILTSSSRAPKPSPSPSLKPNPSPYQSIPYSSVKADQIYSQEYISQQEQMNKEVYEKIERDKKVADFMDTLPFNGQYGRAIYTIDDNRVTLYFKTGQREQALGEFDQLLKQNGIESRDWVYNLIIKADLY